MIDWLTLRLPTKHLSASTLNALQARQGMLSKTAATGELLWRASTREELRAGECRRLGWRLNNHWLELNGSPARLLEKNNVFGDRDPQRCAIEMIGFFERRTGIPLPADLTMWDCTRLDVTQNYMVPSEADVRDALRCMSTVHGGRLRVELRSGSPYWNPRSSLRSGKAYDKGQHLKHQIRKREALASVEQVELCNRLLRLELSLRSQFWRERADRKWHECTAELLEAQHEQYFAPMISALEVTDTNDLLDRLKRVAATDRQANAAYNAWLAIRVEGVDNVRARLHPATFNRHKRLLFEVGLAWADLQCLNRVPLRRRSIEIGPPVHSWFELREAA